MTQPPPVAGAACKAPLHHVYLPPAGLFCSAKPSLVTTVLGSCVAICLWDSRRGCCAVNHFLLPVCSNGRPCLRYGDYSTDKLLEEMLCRGASPTTLEAKVFGGAAVLAVGPSGRNIGAQNVEFAFERLKALGIPVIASRTGGQCGVVIRVFTASRVVLVRPLVSVSVA